MRSKYEQLSQEADSIVKEKIKLLGYCCAQEKAEMMMADAQKTVSREYH